ncbi:MAG: UDP-glucuronic acid decarboxylase family protein [Chloroflexota bacterium]
MVTGGAGFIGSHLCERLLADGHSVLAIDNLLTGSSANVDILRRFENFEFLNHDVTHPFDAQADLFFHLASPASPRGYYEHPMATAMTNALGTKHVLDLCRRHKARMLITSTSEVYGEPEQHPQREDYWGNVNPIGLRACYDESKRFAEAITFVAIREYGVDARVVRLFNTYGPRMDPVDGRIVPNFITQALRNEPITVYGDGSQTRSLCYVDDLVRGLLKMATADGVTGQVVNLGNPDEHTVLEYANLIRELIGSSSELVYRDLPENDPSRRRPDITRARTLLNWSPSVELRDGLSRTIEWFRETLAGRAKATP